MNFLRCVLIIFYFIHPCTLNEGREIVLSHIQLEAKPRFPEKYVEFIRGNFPIVITAPHGGYLTPVTIPERRKSPKNRLLGDLHTQEIARQLVESLSSLGKRPYLVICHLGRSKVDVNRKPGKLAYDNLQAAAVYDKYHEKVLLASKEIRRLFGTGLYLDIHGQRHPQNWIELGYLVDKAQLELPDDKLNLYGGAFSLSRLMSNHPDLRITDLLRGNNSYGGLLASRGYKTVPSPQYPSPHNGSYYRGGYSTDRYWRVGGLDTLQVELPASIRFDLENRKKLINDLAQVTLEFGKKWYGW